MCVFNGFKNLLGQIKNRKWLLIFCWKIALLIYATTLKVDVWEIFHVYRDNWWEKLLKLNFPWFLSFQVFISDITLITILMRFIYILINE